MTNRELHDLDPRERMAHAEWVKLPYSEVCVHMHVAGQLRPVVPLDGGMTQILDANGTIFSAPVTDGEAGVTREREGEL